VNPAVTLVACAILALAGCAGPATQVATSLVEGPHGGGPLLDAYLENDGRDDLHVRVTAGSAPSFEYLLPPAGWSPNVVRIYNATLPYPAPVALHVTVEDVGHGVTRTMDFPVHAENHLVVYGFADAAGAHQLDVQMTDHQPVFD
jgi:hypothetical protein